jgi:hypothetical protein
VLSISLFKKKLNIEEVTFHDGSFFIEGLDLNMYFILGGTQLVDANKCAKVETVYNLNSTRNLKSDIDNIPPRRSSPMVMS